MFGNGEAESNEQATKRKKTKQRKSKSSKKKSKRIKDWLLLTLFHDCADLVAEFHLLEIVEREIVLLQAICLLFGVALFLLS